MAYDLIGQKFGRWTVISRSNAIKGAGAWNVKCDCGTERVKKTTALTGTDRKGRSLSCGCNRYENKIKTIQNDKECCGNGEDVERT